MNLYIFFTKPNVYVNALPLREFCGPAENLIDFLGRLSDQ